MYDKTDSAADLLSDILGDEADIDDTCEEELRLQGIKAREALLHRPWHVNTVPQCADGTIQTLPLLDTTPPLQYRTSSWPPHGGEIVATGGIVWDAALVLSKYLCVAKENLPSLEGVTIELGSGLGLPSIAAHLLGAPEVLCTDVKERLMPIEQNIALNREAGRRIEAGELFWGKEGVEALKGRYGCEKVPLVLCSDVLFNDEAVAPLVESIAALSSPGTVVLSCCEHRWEGALKFYPALEKAGFEVAEVPQEDQHSLYHHSSIHLYRSVKK